MLFHEVILEIIKIAAFAGAEVLPPGVERLKKLISGFANSIPHRLHTKI